MTSPNAHSPIHPSIRNRLDPEYLDFYNRYIQDTTPDEAKPWGPSVRAETAPWPNTSSGSVPVGSIADVDIGECKARVFIPASVRPERGWPVLLWFRGGGWVLGDINNLNNLLTRLCRGANCVVISVDYRAAPEHPFPAAVEDATVALDWLLKDSTRDQFGLDSSRIVVGGTSSGGNLATVLALRTVSDNARSPILHQILLLPVIDNTATTATRWYGSRHSPYLTPARMTWFRDLYLKNTAEAKRWDASPIYAPTELIAQAPPAWIAVAELDLLAPEAYAYAKLYQDCGVPVELQIYESSTHQILTMDADLNAAVLAKGRKLFSDVEKVLKDIFAKAAHAPDDR